MFPAKDENSRQSDMKKTRLAPAYFKTTRVKAGYTVERWIYWNNERQANREQERVSLGNLSQLVFEIEQGKSTPEKSKRLLKEFCECVAFGETIPGKILAFLRAAFLRIVDKRLSTDKALGLVHFKKGVPVNPDTEEKDTIAAAEVLRRRLSGDSFEDAIAAVREELERGDTQVREARRKYKNNALILLRLERGGACVPWSNQEIARLTKFYKNDPSFIPPGKSPN